MKTLTPQPLTPEAFAPFGEVLQAKDDGFNQLVLQPDAPGWQAAINRVVVTEAVNIHRHFNTHECFAPLTGEAVFIVAPPDDPADLHAFRLTAPARVNPNTWHTTIAPHGEAQVFICESAVVEGELIDLPEPVRV